MQSLLHQIMHYNNRHRNYTEFAYLNYALQQQTQKLCRVCLLKLCITAIDTEIMQSLLNQVMHHLTTTDTEIMQSLLNQVMIYNNKQRSAEFA